jgi:hypothetical protein
MLPSIFQQKVQSRTASGNHQVRRTLKILRAQEIPFPLLLRFARKSSHIEEFTVKLNAVSRLGREGAPDRLVRDDICRQQALVGIHDEHAADLVSRHLVTAPLAEQATRSIVMARLSKFAIPLPLLRRGAADQMPALSPSSSRTHKSRRCEGKRQDHH